ncbi:hypothetical protein PV327_002004 [Microctonus hyperodae]|uniref:Uncharacterized protein n=1 Tax=Microctonus hyperodae TaxID=165561 RepID=A0AA39FEU6_MICHY|nr:hypothetical protein PV327_002004 [Microctonus hyperodae]
MDIDGNANKCDNVLKIHESNLVKHVDIMRNTIYLLEKNFNISRYLEAEQWSRFREMKINNEKLSCNLKEVEQRNTRMLNLFRANVTDELPNSLKNQVKRSWQQKYDALLNLNSRLRRELHLKNTMIEEKNCEIAILQQQLLNIGEKLTERDEAVQNIFQ